MTSLRRQLLLVAALTTCLAPTAACVDEEMEGPPAYAEGYEPELYEGYVVYYDAAGRPFYYAEGAAVWVPATSPLYAGYVNHWRLAGPAYGRWYARYGYRYRAYRRRWR